MSISSPRSGRLTSRLQALKSHSAMVEFIHQPSSCPFVICSIVPLKKDSEIREVLQQAGRPSVQETMEPPHVLSWEPLTANSQLSFSCSMAFPACGGGLDFGQPSSGNSSSARGALEDTCGYKQPRKSFFRCFTKLENWHMEDVAANSQDDQLKLPSRSMWC